MDVESCDSTKIQVCNLVGTNVPTAATLSCANTTNGLCSDKSNCPKNIDQVVIVKASNPTSHVIVYAQFTG